MRSLYLDEAGIGELQADPILVVAGVIIHADTHWAALSDDLRNLLLDAVPLGAATPRYLHAKDIFHGSGEFPRDKWPREVRHKLLEEVSKLPGKYDIPIVWSGVKRKEWYPENLSDPHQHLKDCYITAACVCFMQTESYMRELPNQAEVCTIILEQNKHIQGRVQEMFDFGKNPVDTHLLEENWPEYLPLSKLIDSPAYQSKGQSSILQLADYCAFAIKRRLQGASGSTHLTHHLGPNLLLLKSADNLPGEGIWNPRYMPKRWPDTALLQPITQKKEKKT